MAITRIFQTGFELGSTTAETPVIINAIVVNTTAPKTGSYAMEVGFDKSGYWTFTATSQMRYGFHFRHPGADFANRFVSAIRDNVGNVLASIRISADYSGIGFFVGASQVGSYYPINLNTYYHYGIDVKKDASAGWWSFYIDGILVASQTGNTGATQIGGITLGMFGGSNYAGIGKGYFDNLTIDDTTGEASSAPVPDIRYPFVALNGDGTYSEFIPSPTGTHYTRLDEIPPNSTDYVYANSPGLRDSFQFTDYTLSAGASIEAIIPTAVVRKESSVDILLGLGTGLSGTFSVGAFQSLPTSYGLVRFERQTVNPFGNDWDQNDLNNTEVIMMSSGTYL